MGCFAALFTIVIILALEFGVSWLVCALGVWLVSLLTEAVTFSWGTAAIVAGIVMVLRFLFGSSSSKD